MQDAPSPRRARRILRAIGIAVLALLVCAVAAHLAASAICGRALAKQIAALRASGAPLTLAQAAPPPVPPPENAANVYQRAFQQMPNADQRIVEAVGTSWQRLASSPPGPRERQIAAQYAAAIQLARQAAAMPKCRFPVDWNAGGAALFPHYAKLRTLCRLLAIDARVAAADGRPADALADVGAMAGIANHVLMEPLLISQLVGYACLSIGHSALQQVFGLCSPSEEECARLQRRLAAMDLRGAMVRAVAGERTFGLWAFDEIRRHPNRVGELVGGGSEGNGNLQPGGWPSAFVAAWTPFLCADERAYLRLMAAQEEAVASRIPAAQRRRTTEFAVPRYAVLTRAILPAFSRAVDKRDEAMAQLALDQWALALRVYKLRTGRYPSSLDDLRRVVTWPLPSDPMTGRDLAYKPLGNGYLLYSLGLNGKDDGGRGRSQLRPNVGAEGPHDDIAWRQTR